MFIFIHTYHHNFITHTNEFVYQQANDALEAPSEGPLRKTEPLTEILEEKRLKLLGHVLRRQRSHPQHQVTFHPVLARPKAPTLRRAGRPRKFWTTENVRKSLGNFSTNRQYSAKCSLWSSQPGNSRGINCCGAKLPSPFWLIPAISISVMWWLQWSLNPSLITLFLHVLWTLVYVNSDLRISQSWSVQIC